MTAQVIITPARGIYPDMGFYHRNDNVTSIHTYETNYASAFAYWAVKTAERLKNKLISDSNDFSFF